MSSEVNTLFPIFLKAHQLSMLIVGGGEVGLEKLSFLLKSSPAANVKIVSPEIRSELEELCDHFDIERIRTVYHPDHLDGVHVVIAATNFPEVNLGIYNDARARSILVNVADTPDICDFYLGGVVTKGHLKIAISTNGKSPTLAKRLRQLFEEIFPDDIQDLLVNMHTYRKTLKLSFKEKVEHLNQLTKSFIQ